MRVSSLSAQRLCVLLLLAAVMPGCRALQVPAVLSASSQYSFDAAEALASPSASPSAPQAFSWQFPLRNVATLQSLHANISQPGHRQYQQFINRQQLLELTAPVNSTVQAVLDWMQGAGVAASSIIRQDFSLRVQATVQQVESLFQVRLRPVSASAAGLPLLYRANGPLTIPDSLSASFQSLQGVNNLPPRSTHHSRPVTRPASSASPRAGSSGSEPSRHSFRPQSVNGEVDCRVENDEYKHHDYSVSEGELYTTAYFIANQYNFPTALNPAEQTSLPEPVRVAVIGGLQAPDGDGIDWEFFAPSDLNKLAHDLQYASYSTSGVQIVPAPWAAVNNVTVVEANPNGNNGLGAGEASLDIQAVYSYCPACQIGLFASGLYEAPDSTPIYQVFQDLIALNDSQRPHVVSSSYGFVPDYPYTEVPQADFYIQALNTLGTTVVVASGDDGAVSPYNAGCTLTYNNQAGIFTAPWPTSSPYVLAVGAVDNFNGIPNPDTAAIDSYISTSDGSNGLICGTCPNGEAAPKQGYPIGTNYCFIKGGTLQAPQIVATPPSSYFAAAFSSGGGFSNYAAQPSWQTEAVTHYLTACTAANNCTLPPSSWYNSSNRAFPDISFQGSYLPVSLQGTGVGGGGTSLSAPAMAATLAQLVAVSLQLTGQPLGYFNPTLYSLYAATVGTSAAVVQDVTIGNNVCPQPNGNITAANCVSRCGGYYTAPGYDPVTGLGAPNLSNLVTAFTALVTPAVHSSSSSSGGARFMTSSSKKKKAKFVTSSSPKFVTSSSSSKKAKS